MPSTAKPRALHGKTPHTSQASPQQQMKTARNAVYTDNVKHPDNQVGSVNRGHKDPGLAGVLVAPPGTDPLFNVHRSLNMVGVPRTPQAALFIYHILADAQAIQKKASHKRKKGTLISKVPSNASHNDKRRSNAPTRPHHPTPQEPQTLYGYAPS